jgi:hypothetical protein
MKRHESVPSILETDATGETAAIYSDIRKLLGTSVVNLIWRNLATMPGALQWTWSTLRPLYTGSAPVHAEAIRRTLPLPEVPGFSADTLAAAGLQRSDLTAICNVLDSYQYTNALALVVLSALLALFEPLPVDPLPPSDTAPLPPSVELPALPSMAALPPEVVRLIEELNRIGEDGETIPDCEYVSTSGVLAGLFGISTNNAGAAPGGRAVRRPHSHYPRARTCAWSIACVTIEAL